MRADLGRRQTCADHAGHLRKRQAAEPMQLDHLALFGGQAPERGVYVGNGFQARRNLERAREP